jgi:inhibitor of cysteine peptidase
VRSRRSLALVCLLTIAASSGCGAKTPVTLSGSDSGKVQDLVVGQQLRVSLDANPTTGYRWEVDGSLPAQLEMVGGPRYAPESNAIGSGGTQTWTFAGKTPGEGLLRLKYWRSFEPTVPPVKTFSLTAKVR